MTEHLSQTARPSQGVLSDPDITEEELEDESAPDPDPTQVSYTSTDFDVEGLVRRLQRNDIIIPTFGDDYADDSIETARFQRQFVWTKTQMDRFIESLLLGYPIPGIFLVQQTDRRYLVLDGQQRLRTLRAFCQGVVHKKEFSLQSVAQRFRGLTYETLPAEQRRQVDNTFIQATIVQTQPTAESLDAVYQVFERLNSGGTQLTPHEIRIALYAGDFVSWLTKLSESEEWRALYGRPPLHIRDQELILRIIALGVTPGTYRRPLKKYLNDVMAAHRNLGDIDTEDIEYRFKAAARLLLTGPGQSVLRPGGSAVNAALTEALFVGLMRRLELSSPSPAEVTAAIPPLMQNSEMSAAIGRSTADEESVRKRLALATRAFAN
ncbi:DUF262 domain-containing protein [Arthrobacter sp. U41]|uniref:DUF262 domain-containing protein n=1 Tax=Arthrobacter sp. U41 TaxID=1849032 RepID=UPI0008596835|nr:DUF262 domain-containing protein [Arthrobacter sp. U41]AOT05985.1 hypothetical protein ASPU41_21380 [Arthrobacter sp. U41]